jgi:hypothetical protein
MLLSCGFATESTVPEIWRRWATSGCRTNFRQPAVWFALLVAIARGVAVRNRKGCDLRPS